MPMEQGLDANLATAAVSGGKASETPAQAQSKSNEGEATGSGESQDPVLTVVPGTERSSEPGLAAKIEAVNTGVLGGAVQVMENGVARLEKIGPIKRVFDRVRMLRDRLETADINTAVTRADARHNQTSIKAEAARLEAEEAEQTLREKEEMLRVLGRGASEKALAQLQTELEKKKNRHAELVSKLGEKKEKLDGLRTLQSNHETRVNAIIGRVNAPVDAKIAANLAESTILRASEKAMTDRLIVLQKELEELQKINEETAIEWRTQKRGRVKDDLEQAGRLAMAKAQLKADQILRLERKLDATRGRMWDLKDFNTTLERKRVPLLGISRPNESLDLATGKKKKKVIEKRPVRLRARVRRPVGME